MLGFPRGTSGPVRALDEHWDGGGRPDGLKGEAIPLMSRIACLAPTAEVFMPVDGPQGALDVVRERRGRWFDPRIAGAFPAIGPDDPLRMRMAQDATAEVMLALEPSEAGLSLTDDDGLDRAAEAFAGVLHEVGKLGVSNLILDKAGELTDAEFAEVRRRPLYTEQILSRITPVADPAAGHHERIDGRASAAASAPTCCPWRPASSPSPTSTRRSPPTGPIAPRCSVARRSASCGRTPAPPSRPTAWPRCETSPTSATSGSDACAKLRIARTDES